MVSCPTFIFTTAKHGSAGTLFRHCHVLRQPRYTLPIMPDMLVKLYALPDAAPALAALKAAGIVVRRANAWEKQALVDWVRARFGAVWAAGCEVALGQRP